MHIRAYVLFLSVCPCANQKHLLGQMEREGMLVGSEAAVPVC